MNAMQYMTRLAYMFRQQRHLLTCIMKREEEAAVLAHDGATKTAMMLPTSQVERSCTAGTARYSAAAGEPRNHLLLMS